MQEVHVDKFLAPIENAMRWIIIVLTGFMLFWVFFQVLTRYFFSYTPSFGEELARYVFVWIVFLCLPIVAKSGGHMAIEFVTTRVKGRALRAITIAADTLTAVFLAIMIVGGMEMVIDMSYQLSPALRLSMSFVYVVIPFGCLIMLCNTSAAVVIVTPILLPVALSLGIDPTFFGVLMVVNLAIGCITPPVGVDLFVASSIAGISMDDITAKVLPYLGVLLIVLVILTYCPVIITFLPDLIKSL